MTVFSLPKAAILYQSVCCDGLLLCRDPFTPSVGSSHCEYDSAMTVQQGTLGESETGGGGGGGVGVLVVLVLKWARREGWREALLSQDMSGLAIELVLADQLLP